MISLNNISVQFAGTSLFDDVSFIVNKRDRIGLVGKNGAGKTTLMRILGGVMNPTGGSISAPASVTIGYLPQEMNFSSRKTVLDETLEAFKEIKIIEKRIERFQNELASRTDFETTQYHELTQKLADATDRYRILGGDQRHGLAEKVLLGLGYERTDFSRPLAEFSGGWQMRVELAKILLQNPALVMLDEPTNHLDIESIQWLEDFLIEYPGAVMIVSHDRAFLDNVTLRTIEISLGKVYDYSACYTDYELMRQERLELEVSAFNNQQRQIAQVERFITRFRAKNTKAKQVQSKIKMLEKMEKIQVEELDQSTIHFRFPEAPPSGKIALEISGVSKSYGSKVVLQNLNYIIGRGERIAFVGRNGEGKTTLSRIIIGDLEHEGCLKLGHNVKIGYYAQNQAEYLDPDKTVFETIDAVAVGEIRKQTRNILGGFLFSGSDIEKKVKVLSGGEKSRLALACMLLEPINLLVLDEPTNHLDMRSKDILKTALLKFGGTVIIVSHDRDFLQGLTQKVFEFKDRKIHEFHGDVYDFISSRKVASLDLLQGGTNSKSQVVEAPESEGKASWEQKKLFERELRKVKTAIERVESEISKIETEIANAEQIIAKPALNPDLIASGELFAQHGKLKKRLAETEYEWELLHLQIEELEKNGY